MVENSARSWVWRLESLSDAPLVASLALTSGALLVLLRAPPKVEWSVRSWVWLLETPLDAVSVASLALTSGALLV
jgi:hypothetical protein